MPAPLTYKLEGAQLQQAIDLALEESPPGSVKSGLLARDVALQSGMTSDDLEMLSDEDGARARRLGCVCAAMALLLLALALVATLGGGDAAPDATTAVPIAVHMQPPRSPHHTTTPPPPPSPPASPTRLYPPVTPCLSIQVTDSLTH
jgi:hypothetical protein